MSGAADLIAYAACHGLTFLPRIGHEDKWAEVWANLEHHPIDQAPEMLDYQVKYFNDSGWHLEDASVVITQNDLPYGIWPLHVGGPEGTYALTLAGTPLQLPLFRADVTAKLMRRTICSALDTLRSWAAGLGIDSVAIRTHAKPKNSRVEIDFVDRQLLSIGAETRLHHELHVDLHQTMDQIRLNFRKSFRPLVNEGLRTWSTFVMEANSIDPIIWEEFRQLHYCSAGQRWTRGKVTWDSQYAMLQDGTSFLVGLRDMNTKRLTGAGFFQTTRDEGLYAVAAYDRALFNKPLGHVVQFLAIKHMKDMGLSSYRLGDRPYPGDRPEPSAKEVDIGYFKEGFASGIYRAITYILPINT